MVVPLDGSCPSYHHLLEPSSSLQDPSPHPSPPFFMLTRDWAVWGTQPVLPPSRGWDLHKSREGSIDSGQSNRGFRHCGGTVGEGNGTVSSGLWLMTGMGSPSTLDSHLPPPINPAQGLSCAGYLGRVVRRESGKAVGPQWGAASTGS